MKVAKIYPDAKVPTRKHTNDAGIDLYAYNEYLILPFQEVVLQTGITIELPVGFDGQLWPKSRNPYLVGGGIVDMDYQGEILVKIFNPTNREIRIKPGDGIAQMVLIEHVYAVLEEVSIDNIHGRYSERGATGGIVTQSKGEK